MYIFARGHTILLLVGDFLSFAGALVLTLLVRHQLIPSEEGVDFHLEPFIFLFVIWMLVLLIAGLYDLHLTLTRKSISARVFHVQFVNILIAALFFLMLSFDIETKINLVIYLIISTVLLVFWRLYIFRLLATDKPINVLVIGDSKEVATILQEMASNPFFKNLQVSHFGRDGSETFADFRESLLRFVQSKRSEIIIADMRDEFASMLVRDFYIFSFEDRSVRFFNLSSIYEQLLHRVPPSLIQETWLLENVTSGSPHYAYDLTKRATDIVGSLVLLIPTIIIFPFIALVIKLEDKGSLLYHAERVGRYNMPIHIFKFRTMTGRDSSEEALKSEFLVTRVGSFLRKTRLDELPQLFNILVGDLSFVGPRPEIPTLAHVYAENISYYNIRHNMKPGLSGWAQINDFNVPRAGINIERTIEKLSYDLYYFKHRSFLLDMEILLKTVNTILMRTGM